MLWRLKHVPFPLHAKNTKHKTPAVFINRSNQMTGDCILFPFCCFAFLIKVCSKFICYSEELKTLFVFGKTLFKFDTLINIFSKTNSFREQKRQWTDLYVIRNRDFLES